MSKNLLRFVPFLALGYLMGILTVFFPGSAQAYIGPGAGFALVSSFLVVIIAVILASFTILLWPLRYAYRKLKYRNKRPEQFNRIVVLGLDGLSPEIIEKMMDRGKLSNFSLLRKKGSYFPLRTTNPSISPVAWSSFQTGVNPGKHNIFDFLNRDLKTYMPVLSFSRLVESGNGLKLGKYRLPLGKPYISLLRKSKTFWEILGEKGIFSSVLRVPVTFPPVRFHGHMISAMGAPDLKGSQGSFTHYTTAKGNSGDRTGGFTITAELNGNKLNSYISGPKNPFLENRPEMTLPFTAVLKSDRKGAEIRMNGKSFFLKEGEYSKWVPLSFKVFPGIAINGIARFLLRKIEPEFDMYLTPINIDPEKPAMPVSHPHVYSTYLAKLFGPYATLGEAEDTWALNEEIIDKKQFLDQCYLIFDERKKMFFQALKNTRKGVCICVFDTSDRIQHMFYRPSELDSSTASKNDASDFTIEELYEKMDELLGKVLSEIEPRDLLFVVSDHGISDFSRCFNLNAWLHENGYMHLDGEKSLNGDIFSNVLWENTRAYGVGMAGLYINQKGREAHGIVHPGEEKRKLKDELRRKLTGLIDEEKGEVAVLNVYDTEEIYSGPYKENGPDLIIGCNRGYRIGWDSVTGTHCEKIFDDNHKHWKADHCVDFNLVPGVFFSNRKVETNLVEITDLAPTILDIFGVGIPPYMDGKKLKVRHE